MSAWNDTAWMDRAQCVAEGATRAPEPGLWAICQRCPVAAACVAFTTPRSAGRAPVAHGTVGGYSRHFRDGTVPCDACRRAHADRKNERVRAKRMVA